MWQGWKRGLLCPAWSFSQASWRTLCDVLHRDCYQSLRKNQMTECWRWKWPMNETYHHVLCLEVWFFLCRWVVEDCCRLMTCFEDHPPSACCRFCWYCWTWLQIGYGSSNVMCGWTSWLIGGVCGRFWKWLWVAGFITVAVKNSCVAKYKSTMLQFYCFVLPSINPDVRLLTM